MPLTSDPFAQVDSSNVDCVRFKMRNGKKPVRCVVSQFALREHCPDPKPSTLIEMFELVREQVEKVASDKFDAFEGNLDIIAVSDRDLQQGLGAS